jgi:DNA repair protein RadB
MPRRRITTGTEPLDTLLEGGFETSAITTIYGPAATGKTTICMIAAVNRARRGKKVIYVDTENRFSVERMKQIDPDYRETIKKINFLIPKTFNSQKKVFLNITRLAKDASLIIVDTMTSLYRM